MQPNIIERVWRQDKMVNVDVLNGFTFTDEEEAHRFIISGKNVNTPISISGTITANFKNADGVLVPLTGTIEDGKAVVVLSRECYAVEGPFSLMIFADTVCIYAAIANVINSSGDVIAYPTATIPSVQELIEEVQDVIASIPQDYSALNQSVQGLKSAIEIVNDDLATGFLLQPTVTNQLMNAQGEISDNPEFRLTDFIPFPSTRKIIVRCTSSTSVTYIRPAYYSTNSTSGFISRSAREFPANTDLEFSPVSGANYIRFCYEASATGVSIKAVQPALSRVQNVVNPLVFGAVGDGSTDDTSAIIRMLLYMSEKKVKDADFLGLTYKVTASLSVPSNVNLFNGILITAANFGTEHGSAVLMLAGVANVRISLNINSHLKCIYINGSYRVTVEECRLSTYSDATHLYYYGVLINDSSCVILRNMYIMNPTTSEDEWYSNDGIHIVGGCQNIWIENIVGTANDDFIGICPSEYHNSASSVQNVTIKNIMNNGANNAACLRITATLGDVVRNITLENCNFSANKMAALYLTNNTNAQYDTDNPVFYVRGVCLKNCRLQSAHEPSVILAGVNILNMKLDNCELLSTDNQGAYEERGGVTKDNFKIENSSYNNQPYQMS